MKTYSTYLTNVILYSNKNTSASHKYEAYKKTLRLRVSLRTNIWPQLGGAAEVPTKPNISVPQNSKVTINLKYS